MEKVKKPTKQPAVKIVKKAILNPSKVVSKNTKKAAVKVSKPTVKTVSKPKTEVKNASITSMANKQIRSAAKSLKVQILGVNGSSKGNMTLSSEVFGAKPNKILIAQAIRVHLANQRSGTASTKTRGDVVGSTRKIYRQKGTGRARHGALKAPIFVGGGVAHGPKPHDFSLKLPHKMRKKALISALSDKAQAGCIKVIDGEFSGKTKEVANLIKKMELIYKGKVDKVLLVIDNNDQAVRAARNLYGLEITSSSSVSTYSVVVSKKVIFFKNAIEELSKRLTN